MFKFSILFLSILVISSLAVVFTRHQHRVAFIDLQQAQQYRDQLNIEWEQLLLEQSTWSFQSLVEKNARERLGMKYPSSEQIVVVSDR